MNNDTYLHKDSSRSHAGVFSNLQSFKLRDLPWEGGAMGLARMATLMAI